jgi:hypothetical protein
MRDFSKQTLKALARRGITLIGLTVIPGTGDMPFATGERGYCVADNGTHRVWSFADVLAAAK